MITKQQRTQVEELVYKIFDTIDKTKTNSDYYRDLFSKMNDDDF